MNENESFEHVSPTLPGNKVLRRRRKPGRRLRLVPQIPGIFRFIRDIVGQTPIITILSVLLGLILIVSAGVYYTERGTNEAFSTYADALWWTFTGMQTMGPSDHPQTAGGQIIGIVGVIILTFVFWGAIIATITSYFSRARQKPTTQIIATVQYNLDKLPELPIEELELLKETTIRIIDNQINKNKDMS